MYISYEIKNLWYGIRNFFNPRQRWLTKQIPNSWVDKDWLWELCILEGIKHYVEKDDGLGDSEIWRCYYVRNQADPEYPQHQKDFDKEMYQMYDLITIRLPELEEQLEEAWSKVPKRDITKLPLPPIDYEATYGEVDRIEKEITDLKTKIMVWAITNREKIWT